MRDFHPAVARWFQERFGDPTPVQRDGWEAIRTGRHTLIVAPTGSGKTLAAFLISLDRLLREGLDGRLPDETRVLYVSPLKALSADIHFNLAEPRKGIRKKAEEAGWHPPKITAAVRTGDTPASERSAMLRKPPHILVTTPESLYLLLTAARSREMLRTVRTVIVDEIHAVVESKRGAHLALSLERLEHVAGQPLQRIGLSATVNPVEEVSRFLVGQRGDCAVVNRGHRRELDLKIELPRSPLEAVMSAEVWEEVYDRLAQLIAEHGTTLVFVNTRRMAERVARHLSDRLGEQAVTSHHGSLSKEMRLDAERRLREGKLRALVATASLELGIDIGAVDLVCQLGSPRRISTFLQRVGRSGHTVKGTPKGRIFPLSRDDLVECIALLRGVRAGRLDRVRIFEKPLDVLAQQIVAEAACEDWSEDGLFGLFRRAYPYRSLQRMEFDEVVEMLATGFTTRRGRRGALVHHDAVNRRLRGRRGSRLTAITCGGTIPDTADYRVVLDPEGLFLGTVNEDFAIESLPGDVFQLGNTSWRILKVENGVVRVADAQGEPPSVPFWLGEAPGRSDELSDEVSCLRSELESFHGEPQRATAWLQGEVNLEPEAAEQVVAYLFEARRLLGALPTKGRLIAERFFDEAGGMQLVIHSPYGSRVNRAWGLALRKRFCRQFNFELQAAATEDALLLSLGPQHSFPLIDVFRYLRSGTVRDVLVQALIDAPVFQTRWRWNATVSLALPRQRGGKKTPPQIQRMEAEDLLAAVFPDAAACLENIAGDREIPDHPLVRQTLEDSLREAMDLDGLVSLLEGVEEGEIACEARDLPEPSPLAHEILNARPYAFLDDAPLEERRAHAVYTRRALEPSAASDLGALDPEAIARVRAEARPEAANADELHDALLTSGFLTEREALEWGGEAGNSWRVWLEELAAEGRAGVATVGSGREERKIWIAAERLGELLAVHPDARLWPPRLRPPATKVFTGSREEALKELFRGRMEIAGPVESRELADSFGIDPPHAEVALLALEAEGTVLRGRFSPGSGSGGDGPESVEWCHRRLLARIHRYTLDRLRAEIEPVSAADFVRFLVSWQRVDAERRAGGVEGLAAVIGQLEGFELAAQAWEPDVLNARVEDYECELLDSLCLTGRIAWLRLLPPASRNGATLTGPVRSTPIALVSREHLEDWLVLARGTARPESLSAYAVRVLEVLEERGACFFGELVSRAGLLPTQVESALGELVIHGLVTADSFAGLRALLVPSDRRKPLRAGAGGRRRAIPYGVESAGRWSCVERTEAAGDRYLAAVEFCARVLLRRYGVVFRRLLIRESLAPPWRELLAVYRRLEARGEIRGGRFVAGMSGEQFALPEAVSELRRVRRAECTGILVAVSAADPLNLVGIVTPGDRVPALGGNRVLYRDGVPLAARIGGEVRMLGSLDGLSRLAVERALIRRSLAPALRAYLGRAG
ncbi:MAG: ATP-dependent DNA helicase [Gemmatimonadales bacterium]|nr:MAG: ATP-dependent DNA helicase [Gemmatimonadales bacterium]